MRTAFVEALTELAANDQRVFLITGDLGYSVLEKFASRFPDQFLNAGVAEQNLTGIAAGLAASGRVVFTYSIANFPTFRCLEQIRNDVCYHRLDVNVVAVGGGLVYGTLGYTHHAVEDLAIMRALPGMTVVAPADPVETRLATVAMARKPGPGYLRLGRAGERVIHQAEPPFELGRAIRLREGDAATLITTGGVLHVALRAAGTLERRGWACGVISMPTIKPLDVDGVLAAAGTKVVVTVEEHSIVGGLGTAVAEVLAEHGVAVAFRRVALPDELRMETGSQEYLRRGLDVVADVVTALLEARP